MDPEMLQEHELGTLGFELRQSKMSGAGLGVFTSKRLGAGDVIGKYYGTTVYDNLSVGYSNSSSVYT